jgi:hypothetical protein
MTDRVSNGALHFLIVAGAICTTALVLAGQLPGLAHPEAIALGITLDLTVLVPLAYYFLVVRPKGWPPVAVAPIIVLSLLIAAAVLPSDHQQTLRVLRTLLVPAEIGLLGWIGWQAFRALWVARDEGAADPLEALHKSARASVPVERAADVLASELAVLHYALFSWRSRAHRPNGALAFSSHKRSGHGGLVFVLLVLAAVEVVAIHVLLALWSPVIAWIVTALNLYGALWLVADYRASILRPVLVDSDEVWLRAGLRWQARVPRRMIAAVVRTAPGLQERTRSLAFLTTPNLWLEFSEPIDLAGPYGIRRRVRKVGVFVDNPAELERFVNSAT